MPQSPSVQQNASIFSEKEIYDYQELLEGYNLSVIEDNFYLYVGEANSNHGWILHISISIRRMPTLMNRILPILTAYQLPFKIVKNQQIHDLINTGIFGDFKTGKIVTIYLVDNLRIKEIIKPLIDETSDLQGPVISTDLPLTQVLYIRYGSHKKTIDMDPLGNLVPIIVDSQGNHMIDKYSTPPIIPKGIYNPFLNFAPSTTFKPNSYWIANKVLPLKLLKKDPKGNVWFGIYYHPPLSLKWCAIKQGVQGMFLDLLDRDAIDRISAQHNILKKIQKKVRATTVIDTFLEKNKSYIVLKYIWRGKDLIKIIRQDSANKPWYLKDITIRKKHLVYFLKILQQISILHRSGIVHRDITGTNFYITKSGNVHLIDLELAYSIKDRFPCPAFRGGTFGYMSPEQLEEKDPNFSQDIYSLGALLLMIITGGIEPVHFIEDDKERLKGKIFFLCQDIGITDIIMSCLSKSPMDRMSINEISQKIEANIDLLSKKGKERKVINSDQNINDVIEFGFNGLMDKMFINDNLWLSKVENNYSLDIYPLIDRHTFGTIYRGVGGIIRFLVESQRYKTPDLKAPIFKGIEFMDSTILKRLHSTSSSYYFGSTGVATVISSLIQSYTLPNSDYYKSKIAECFTKVARQYDIIDGIAGQGLAALQCGSCISQDFLDSTLEKYTQILIAKQQKNGSWIQPYKVNNYACHPGFGYGIAGIAYYLFEYGSRYSNIVSIKCAERALRFIKNSTLNYNKGLHWNLSQKKQKTLHGWCMGQPGIALSFLKAYEVTKNKTYLKVVTEILERYPSKILFSDLSQSHGLSGLGEVYLEVNRVNPRDEWQERSTWIVSNLLTFKIYLSADKVYWKASDPSAPTADFMIGTTGILHFLLRYQDPSKFSFPFLPTFQK